MHTCTCTLACSRTHHDRTWRGLFQQTPPKPRHHHASRHTGASVHQRRHQTTPPPNLDLPLPEILQQSSSSSPWQPLQPPDLTRPPLHALSPHECRNLSSWRCTPFFGASDTRRALHLHRLSHGLELERPTVVDCHLVSATTSTNESHDEALGPLPCHQ
jgi:hypothetical protein